MPKIESQAPLEVPPRRDAPIKRSVLGIGRALDVATFFFSIFMVPALVFAQDQARAYIDPNLGGPVANVGQFVAALIGKYAVPFAVVAALVIIVFAGFEYITSGGAPEALTKSKELIVGAVLGLLTVFLIGWFLQSIIPEDELKDAGGTTSSSGAKVSTAPDPDTDPIGYLNYERSKLLERIHSSAGLYAKYPTGAYKNEGIVLQFETSVGTESSAIDELRTKITRITNDTKLSNAEKAEKIKTLKPTIEKLMTAIRNESAKQQGLLENANKSGGGAD